MITPLRLILLTLFLLFLDTVYSEYNQQEDGDASDHNITCIIFLQIIQLRLNVALFCEKSTGCEHRNVGPDDVGFPERAAGHHVERVARFVLVEQVLQIQLKLSSFDAAHDLGVCYLLLMSLGVAQILEVPEVKHEVHVRIVDHPQARLVVHKLVIERLQVRGVDRDQVQVLVAQAFLVALGDHAAAVVDVAARHVVLDLVGLIEVHLVAGVVAFDRVDIFVAVDRAGAPSSHIWLQNVGFALPWQLVIAFPVIPACRAVARLLGLFVRITALHPLLVIGVRCYVLV